jgi:CheY-like chemotaxis protein
MSRFVYLIDADANLNQYLQGELARYGLRVEASTDANEVMARKDDLPQLIVLCIDPKRTGWAVCNRLRKSASLKSVPLVITSAEATEKDFEDHKKLKTRAEDYLHKPFGVESLVEKIAAQIGLPEPSVDDGALDLAAEEIAVEDEGLVVEDDVVEEEAVLPGLGAVGNHGESSFIDEDSADRTRIGVVSVDDDVNLETDQAFAAIGLDADDADNTSTSVVTQADLRGVGGPSPHDVTAHEEPRAKAPVEQFDNEAESPFDGPQPMTDAAPEPMAAKAPSVDLDLGLDAVAQEAEKRPAVTERPRRQSSPNLLASTPSVMSSAPAPAPVSAPAAVHDTAAHDTSSAAVQELKSERDRLKREVDELQKKLTARPETAAAPTGFSREREFLNLREIINKKEKEILDLRDVADAKERQFLDTKDKVRELERRARDLDEKVLTSERDLVAAREKIEALTHDKERVVEREKQVKGRLDDALKSLQRYEEEIEGWKKKHADDTAVLERNYNEVVAQHQQEVSDLKNRHAAEIEGHNEQQAAQLRDTIAKNEAEKQSLVDRHAEERGRLEADHAGQLQRLRETKDNERESLRLRFEQQLADQQEQQQVELQGLAEQHAQKHAQTVADYEAKLREAEQLHADEIAGLRARYTTDTKASERKHAEEIAKLHESYRGELAAAEQQRIDELAQKAEEHRLALEAQSRENLVERSRLEREHENALAQLDQQRQTELQAAEQRRIDELARLKQELEQKLADELKTTRESHLRKMQALEESHADVKAGMQQRHATQVDEMQKQHAGVVAQFEAAIKERDQLITDGHNRMNELEGTLAEEQSANKKAQGVITGLEQQLAAARVDIGDRDKRLEEKTHRIGELEQESAGYQDQILKAYQRIKSDESIVSRAKKALAIALTLLDESAADGSDEASS